MSTPVMQDEATVPDLQYYSQAFTSLLFICNEIETLLIPLDATKVVEKLNSADRQQQPNYPRDNNRRDLEPDILSLRTWPGILCRPRIPAYPHALDPAGCHEEAGLGSRSCRSDSHPAACDTCVSHASKSGHQRCDERRSVRPPSYLMDRILGHRSVSRHGRNRPLRDHQRLFRS